MNYLLILCQLVTFPLMAQSLPEASTELTIQQSDRCIVVDSTVSQIVLLNQAFTLTFHSLNTNRVYLNASYDSTCFCAAINDSLANSPCFVSSGTYSETVKNRDLDIYVTSSCDRGHHCLFGHSVDDQFIRFDKVELLSNNEFIGHRTVISILQLPGGDIPVGALAGKTVYLVYSPGEESKGKTLKITFVEQ